MGYRLGVDLGTTWTAAAVYDGVRPSMVGLGNRALQIPSVVLVGRDGHLLVGEAAERRALAEPDRVAREFKRRIADPVPIYLAGVPYSPRRLTAEVLAWVVSRTTERVGAAPSELTLTHPATWGGYRRGLLDEIRVLAGVDQFPVTYRTEPEAAAAQYAHRTGSPVRGTLLVYDLGGGTFDVCLLESAGSGFTLVGASAGIENLGGVDFDELILRRVVEHFDLTDIDLGQPEVLAGLNRLRRECTEAKEALSADTDVAIPVVLPGLDRTFRLHRTEFEEMIRPTVMQTIEHTRRVLEHTSAGELAGVVLVGGSSRIPLISELLTRELGVPVAVDTHPKHDVALGAALPDRPALPEPPALPDQPAPAAATGTEPAAAVETSAGPGVSTPDPRRRARLIRLVIVAAVVLALGAAAFVVRRWTDGQQAAPAARESPSLGVTSAAIPRSAAPLPDDVLVWPRVRDGVWGIGTLSLSGQQTTLAASPPLDSSFPVLSPDRRSVIYLQETTEQWSLRVVGVDGHGDRDLLSSVPGCRRVQAPAWGPDDVFALPCQKSSGSGTVLELVSADGKVGRILDRGDLGDPTFSRDGRTIVYWRSDDGKGDGGALYRISADGTGRQRLTVGGELDNDPVLSPDGHTVAYRTTRANHFVIATIDLPADATSRELPIPRILSPGDVDEQEPSWDPAGDQLAFTHGDGDNRDLWLMRTDGSDRRPLTQDREADAAPAWTAR